MDAITESRLRLAITCAPRYAERLREAVAASLVTVPPDAVSWRHASDPRPWLETSPRFRVGRLAPLAAEACRRCERFVESALDAELLLRHGCAGHCPSLRARTCEELETAASALVTALGRLLAGGRHGHRPDAGAAAPSHRRRPATAGRGSERRRVVPRPGRARRRRIRG